MERPAASPRLDQRLDLRLTNTMGGAKTPLRPLKPGSVRMYHCGPTMIEPVNIDKFRSYLLGDVLRRYLEYAGLSVRQVMNITDVGHLNEFEEDSVEIAASRSGLSPWELAEQEEKLFHEDRRSLNILDAHVYPRARDHVADMIQLIEELLAAGKAYRVGNAVYFDSSKSPTIGKLVGKSREELAALEASRAPMAAGKRPTAIPGAGDPGATVPAADQPGTGGPARGSAAHPKRHPLDFDLWRADPLHQMQWQSPWGRGFPGWHVECVVMGRKHLGVPFDVHSGSEENIYPHHECEIAQADAVGGKLAEVWLHSRHVLLEGKPVSRQNRNQLTVRGLKESGVPGPEIRGALLSVPFRQPIEFTPDAIDTAHETIASLKSFIEHHRSRAPVPGEKAAGANPAAGALRERIDRAEKEFRAGLDDDLDVPAALAAAMSLLRDLDGPKTPPAPEAAEAVARFDKVLGLL